MIGTWLPWVPDSSQKTDSWTLHQHLTLAVVRFIDTKANFAVKNPSHYFYEKCCQAAGLGCACDCRSVHSGSDSASDYAWIVATDSERHARLRELCAVSRSAMGANLLSWSVTNYTLHTCIPCCGDRVRGFCRCSDRASQLSHSFVERRLSGSQASRGRRRFGTLVYFRVVGHGGTTC
jgi:hypothetical protein